MDKYNAESSSEMPTAEKGRKRGFFSGITESVNEAIEKRKKSREAPVYDLAVFLLGLVFARCHIIFGAHPLGIALVALLPSRVWVAVLGAAVGSLTLGQSGVIYAMITVITVFLRIIVSGTDKPKGGTGARGVGRLFSESLLLRMASAVIAGFIAAVYEILLSGFSMTAVLFGASMILLPPLIAFLCSGLFDAGITYKRVLFDNTAVFKTAYKSDKEKFDLIFFQCSALVFLFLVGLSLGAYELFGVSAGYIFVGFCTVFVARRFGALRAAAVGFAAALGLSSWGAVSFGLLGIAAGALFRVGIPYAIVGGGIALCAWSAYAGGVAGLVGVLPEYLISALLIYPLLKRIPEEKTEEQTAQVSRGATDMVGTVALSYKNRYSGSLDALESSLGALSRVLQRFGEKSARPRPDELKDLILECADKYCRTCEGYSVCTRTDNRELMRGVDDLTTKLYKNGVLSTEDFERIPDFCSMAQGLCESVNRAVAMLTEERFRESRRDRSADAFELISGLIAEARARDAAEKSVNDTVSAALCASLDELGLSHGVARVFGERIPHFIIAAEDIDGTRITSAELKREMERLSGRCIATPEFFRRGNMALMECSCAKAFAAECATAGVSAEGEEVSGDTVCAYESGDGHFYTLLSDGMGSGEEAHETSEFVTEFLTRALEAADPGQTVLKILNHALRQRRAECSATADLFSLDLYSGEALFIKSGAAASYVKRGSSIFRISSRTAPLGLMKNPDAERIKVEIQSDDYIIMMSDGITQSQEDSPWLLELLSRAPKKGAKEYAEHILSGALKNVPHTDDMTVAVVRIKRVGQ